MSAEALTLFDLPEPEPAAPKRPRAPKPKPEPIEIPVKLAEVPPLADEPAPPAAVPVDEPAPLDAAAPVDETPPLVAAQPPEKRVEIAPVAMAEVLRLERELGVSHPVAQVLVRRGYAEPEAARAWLAADVAHPLSAFGGMDEAVAVILTHVDRGSKITIHGDYDVDGVCSTAILVRVLERLRADVHAYLPSRSEDGYGLNARTVDRLASTGTQLLITADCAITAVEEVAQARAAGMDVVVTDHHTPRPDGQLPDAPIVHPGEGLGDYPCPHLCAAGVAYKLATALLTARGESTEHADEDLDLVALATIADVVPLIDENRRLVRQGLRAFASTRKPGLRALLRAARCDPSRVDAQTLAFNIAPRINAAGRLYRADAGLELVLTDDHARATEVAEELDRVNGERRHTQQRILFEAETQVAQQGERSAYVLAGDDWHPGVVGIVASKIAERYCRPAILIAMDPQTGTGTGSGRSVAGFDLLAGLNASAAHLNRHGGHRAAAGLELDAANLDAFRAAFTAHADEHLTDEQRRPTERVDAVVAGDELGLGLAEELAQLAPFGHQNPGVSLLVPAARLTDPRPMGDTKQHLRFTVEAGGVRARAVAFSCDGKLPCDADGPVDAAFALELNEFQGAVEPRLVLRAASPTQAPPIALIGEDPFLDAALAEFDAPLPDDDAATREPELDPAARDRRDGGLAGTIGALVHSGERVLVVAAHAQLRARHLDGLLGGFDLTSHAALRRDPQVAAAYDHVVLLDPPAHDVAHLGADGPFVHLAWGRPEVDFSLSIHERERDLRTPLTAIYRSLRATGGAAGEELEAALREDDPQRTPAVAGRALRVLVELGLVHLDRERRSATVPAAERTELERSDAYRAYSGGGESAWRAPNSRSTPQGPRPETAPATATAA
ncbi:MAG TPA: single-stranded-DNA-specific exonuclease RecJ [Solirubrobacteraceae bacterium]|nr:single-stranded-DNA-specific exonuclease RecJ [Solirubrobacteraceae bacterium]